MDKERFKAETVPVIIIIAICIIAVAVIKQFQEIPKTDTQLLQEILQNKTGESNDYRQGFNDCINELQKLHPKVGDTT